MKLKKKTYTLPQFIVNLLRWLYTKIETSLNCPEKFYNFQSFPEYTQYHECVATLVLLDTNFIVLFKYIFILLHLKFVKVVK